MLFGSVHSANICFSVCAAVDFKVLTKYFDFLLLFLVVVVKQRVFCGFPASCDCRFVLLLEYPKFFSVCFRVDSAHVFYISTLVCFRTRNVPDTICLFHSLTQRLGT